MKLARSSINSPAIESRFMPPRRFPPPWTVDEMNNACFIVRDTNGQQLGYFYYEQESGRRTAANLLTKDEARRLAVARAPAENLPACPAWGWGRALRGVTASWRATLKH